MTLFATDEDHDPGENDLVSGCLFPGECLMPGDHYTVECHDVSMVEPPTPEERILRAQEVATRFSPGDPVYILKFFHISQWSVHTVATTYAVLEQYGETRMFSRKEVIGGRLLWLLTHDEESGRG